MKKIVLIFMMVLMFASVSCAMPTIQKDSLSWIPPTTNVDGSALTDLKGFKVYWSIQSGVYADIKSKDVGKVVTIDIKTLIGQLNGIHYFVVTAYDSTGNESGFSNEVSASFFIPMNVPANLGIK